MSAIKWIFSLVIPLIIGVGILLTFVFSVNNDVEEEKEQVKASIQGSETDSESRTEKTESGLASTYQIFPLAIPQKLEFAGEKVPVYQEEVKNRLDRELLVNTYWQSHTLLLMKRANRRLPIIEDILEKNGIPKDFKYLPIAESDLKNVVSPAGAVGFWQFMKASGKERGLEIRDQVDERYDLKKATKAACQYLQEAYREFGNWTLVAASFNLGISGVKRALRQQEVDSYYDLKLNPETSRYVFRILAIKEILQNPERYGFRLNESDLYQPYRTQTVEVSGSVSDWVNFAQKHNITYKTLKEYNPWIQRKRLDNRSGKIYEVDIPEEAMRGQGRGRLYQKDTLANMPREKAMAIHGQTYPGAFKTHRVKEGQTIHKIAKHYQVRVTEIMEWNHLNTSFVKRGQTLKILKRAID